MVEEASVTDLPDPAGREDLFLVGEITVALELATVMPLRSASSEAL